MGLLNKLKQAASGFMGNDTPSTPTPNPVSVQEEVKEVKETSQQSSSGQLYSPQMEKLIEMAVADGELTEKEKQVLFKRAEAEGIDLDELEMVVEARLHQVNQKNNVQNQPLSTSSNTNTNKYGDVKKCPVCGAMIESFTTCCPDCGYEFRNIESSSSVKVFFKKMEEIENANISEGAFDKFSSMAGWGLDKKTKQKSTLISNFPIPTTKEDILEFLMMAVPLAKPISFSQKMKGQCSPEMVALQPVWKRKCENIIMKAKFSMREDKKTLEMIAEYAKELKIKM